MQNNLFKAMLYILLSSLSVAIMGVLAKIATPLTSTTVIVFFQNLISFIVVFPWVICSRSLTLKTEYFALHICRALAGAGAWYAMFLAIKLISLNNAVLLTYTASLWVPLFSWIAFKQVISKRIWGSVLIGFIGIGMILNPGKGFLSYGDFVGVSAGILLAIAFLLVKVLNKTEPPSRILFYYFLISSIFFSPLALFQWHPIHLLGLVYLLGIGICLAISQLLLILAYQVSTPAKLSPYVYSAILFTAILNWLIWRETPTLFETTGMLLVIFGGILTTLEKPQTTGI